MKTSPTARIGFLALAWLVAGAVAFAPGARAEVAAGGIDPREQEILDRGEISDGSYLGGAIAGSTLLPLGIGQAIQGRYQDTGWIFTFGEMTAVAVILAGRSRRETLSGSPGLNPPGSGAAVDSEASPVLFMGWLLLAGIRVWEIADLWIGPPAYNRSYRRLKSKHDAADQAAGATRTRLQLVPLVTASAQAGASSSVNHVSFGGLGLSITF